MRLLWQMYFELTDLHPEERIPRCSDVPFRHIRSIITPEALVRRLEWIITKHNHRIDTMLPEPFPSSPTRQPRYELKVKHSDGKVCIKNFCEVYPAKKFVELLIGDREWGWINTSTIVCHDIILKSRHLARFITHEYTSAEREWQLPMPHSYHARVIAYGESHSEALASLNERTHHNAQEPEAAPSGASGRKKRRQRSSSPVDPAATKPKKVKDGDLLGIPQLSAALNLDPSKVRGLLRRTVDKPQGGWAWSPVDYEDVLKKLRKS